MQKISGLIGKEAITLADASSRGTVLNVYFDAQLNRCKYFTLICDDSDQTEWVAFKNLCSLNNDAVVIKSEGCIRECPDTEVAASPINLPAFNQDGVLLGTIRDIELDGDKAVNIITDLKTIPAHTLLSMSAQLLVFNDSDQAIKLKKNVKKTTADTLAGQKSRAVIPSAPKKTTYEFPTKNTDENAEGVLLSAEKQTYIMGQPVQNSVQNPAELPFAPPEFAFYRQAVELMTKTSGNDQKETQSAAQAVEENPVRDTKKEPQKTTEFDAENQSALLKFPTYRQAVEFAAETLAAQKESAAEAAGEIPLRNTEKEPQKSTEHTTQAPTQKSTKKTDWLNGREVQTPAKIPPQQTSVYRSPSEENIQTRFGFLLGKRVQRPIYGRDGQVLVRENALVDEEIIRRVKENGKLVMLALHSL